MKGSSVANHTTGETTDMADTATPTSTTYPIGVIKSACSARESEAAPPTASVIAAASVCNRPGGERMAAGRRWSVTPISRARDRDSRFHACPLITTRASSGMPTRVAISSPDPRPAKNTNATPATASTLTRRGTGGALRRCAQRREQRPCPIGLGQNNSRHANHLSPAAVPALNGGVRRSVVGLATPPCIQKRAGPGGHLSASHYSRASGFHLLPALWIGHSRTRRALDRTPVIAVTPEKFGVICPSFAAARWCAHAPPGNGRR